METVAVIYELVTVSRDGEERRATYATEEPLTPGSVVRFKGRDWLVERIEDGDPPRALAKPARYRVRLVHPDGREELGAFRRFRPDGPRLGHAFTALEDGQPISWQVVHERLAYDDEDQPYLDLVAERDFAEADADLPDHELEHVLAGREAGFPEGAIATLSRAEAEGLSVELVRSRRARCRTGTRPSSTSTRSSSRRSRTTCSSSAASTWTEIRERPGSRQ